MTIIATEPLIWNDMNYFIIDGRKVLRRVYWTKHGGLYILYKGKKYFEYEFIYKYDMEVDET